MSPTAWRRSSAVGLLALALFFGREALSGERAFFLRDLQVQWFGQVESFVHAVAEGAWPVWDPFPFFGQPMLGNPNVQVLYPPTWLNLVVRPWTFYTLYFVGHLLVAGLGAVAAARALGASRLAALAAGALWLASGPLLSLGNLWNHLGAAAWLPWAIAAATRGSPHGTCSRSALGWGAAIGLMVLAGSPDLAVLSGLATAALALSLGRPVGAQLARAALAALCALALSAGQWWPALDWAVLVGRLDLPASQRLYWSVEPAALWQALVPVPWRSLVGVADTSSLFEGREPLLLSVYLGLPALGLALLGSLDGPRRMRLSLLSLAALAVAFSLGDRTPLYGWLTEDLPLLRPLRFPSKALVPAACCVCLLAGLGLDAWRRAVESRAWRPALVPVLPVAALLALTQGPLATSLLRPAGLAAAALVLTGLAHVRPRRANLAAAAWTAIAVADLAVAHAGLNPTAPRAILAEPPRVAAELRDHRSFVFGGPADGAVRGFPVPPLPAAWRGRGSWGRNLLGLQPRRFDRLSGLVALTDDAALRVRLLVLASVERVVALEAAGFETLGPPRRLGGPSPLLVFDVAHTLPRAYAVGRAQRLADDEAERRLVSPRFEAGLEVLLPEGVASGAGRVFPSTPTVRWLEERADRLAFDVELPHDGWLVVNDLWAPGWRAEVDGRATRVERANLIFRAVAVPAGRHHVRLLYRPRGLVPALACSAAAALYGLFVACARAPAARGTARRAR